MMLVGEAWGKDEEAAGGTPFVGPAGRVLTALLSRAGINRDDCYITNVFNFRPKPTNDIKNLCGSKGLGIPGWPALSSGKYALAQYKSELDRLFAEVKKVKPNLVVALGATATWALSHETPKITQQRGSPFWSPLGVKVLPTFHPSSVLQGSFSNKPIIWADLSKAKIEDGYPEVRSPQREIWIEPTLQDLTTFWNDYIEAAPLVSVDIETKGNQISCVGFSPAADRALVVPFLCARGNYWETLQEEKLAWDFVRAVLATKKVLFQNGLFDMQHLWRTYGLPIPQAEHDTMLLHHALQPEMKKSLGFLASIYTMEPSWKFMGRSLKKEDTE